MNYLLPEHQSAYRRFHSTETAMLKVSADSYVAADLVSSYQHRRLLPATSVTTCEMVVRRRRIDNTWPVAALTARSETLCSESRFLPTPPAFNDSVRGDGELRSEYCMSFGTDKLEWLNDSEKISKISLFVLTECTNVTDTQTHTQTHTHRMMA